MVCEKCKKEINDDSAFCCYCGKRVKKQTSGMPLYEHLRFLSDEDAKKAVQQLAALPADKIKAALNEKQEAVYVYVTNITYRLNSRGKLYNNHVPIEQLRDRVELLVDGNGSSCSSVACIVKRAKLNANTYVPEDEGVAFFRTAQECKKAASDALKEYGARIKVYIEEEENA